MKRKFILAASIVVLALGLMAGSASAALPGSGWWTAYVVANLSNTSAQVDASASELQGGSATTYSSSNTIAASANQTYHPSFCGGSGLLTCFSPSLPSGFNGSVVLSSNQPIAAVVQLGNNASGSVGVSGGTASAQYNGKSSGSQSIGAPVVKHNFANKTTTFYVQAAGSAASVTATYKMNNGQSFTDGPHSISANKSYLFDPSAASVPSSGCGSDPNASACVGAVTFASTSGAIVGVVIEHEHSASPGKVAQSTALFADTDGNSKVYCPVFKNAFPSNNPRYTGLTVQNVGTSAVTVNLTATGSAGAGNGQTYTDSVANLAPGASHIFHSLADNIGTFDAGTFGAVTLEATDSNAKLVATINEANFSGTSRQTTFGCFGAASATSKVSLPLHKENFSNNITGIALQNVGTSSTDVTATFTCGSSSYTHVAKTVAAGAGDVYYLPSGSSSNWSGTPMPSGSLCAVTLQASSGGSIVAIAQEAANGIDLDTKNYEGFNIQ